MSEFATTIVTSLVTGFVAAFIFKRVEKETEEKFAQTYRTLRTLIDLASFSISAQQAMKQCSEQCDPCSGDLVPISKAALSTLSQTVSLGKIVSSIENLVSSNPSIRYQRSAILLLDRLHCFLSYADSCEKAYFWLLDSDKFPENHTNTSGFVSLKDPLFANLPWAVKERIATYKACVIDMHGLSAEAYVGSFVCANLLLSSELLAEEIRGPARRDIESTCEFLKDKYDWTKDTTGDLMQSAAYKDAAATFF